MVTGELKNKVDGLWEIFWTGGLTNPLDVIEQMTYLMFIRDLDDSDNVHMKESIMLGLPYKSIFEENVTIGDRKVPGNQLKWSVFHDFPAQKMYANMQENVFPFIKNLHGDKESAYAKYMGDAIFKVPTPVMLDKIVTAMDEIYEKMEQLRSEDVRGDIYEYLLSKLATAGVNGQFRTPRHIIKMMVEMMDPKADDLICDPACGTSGFLVESSEYLRKKKKAEVLFNAKNKEHYMNHMFHGYDMDRTMLRIGAMNMMTHGVSNPNIEYRDSLSDQNEDKEKYSLILANPPFKGSLDYDIVSADLLKVCKTKKTELLFLTLFVRMLKTGGRCACIVPDGVLFGSSKAHKDIRKAIVEEQRLEAVISMFIAFGLLYWVTMSRIIRGQVLQLKQQEYVTAARALGASGGRIIRRHLLPNCIGQIVVTTCLQIPSAIFLESFLSYLGVGVSAPLPSLGSMATDALSGMYTYTYRLIVPSVILSIMILAFNLFGDGLRDALDPKLKK